MAATCPSNHVDTAVPTLPVLNYYLAYIFSKGDRLSPNQGCIHRCTCKRHLSVTILLKKLLTRHFRTQKGRCWTQHSVFISHCFVVLSLSLCSARYYTKQCFNEHFACCRLKYSITIREIIVCSRHISPPLHSLWKCRRKRSPDGWEQWQSIKSAKQRLIPAVSIHWLMLCNCLAHTLYQHD